MDKAAELGAKLGACATEAGAYIVEGYVDADARPTIPEVLLDSEAALALIAAVRPRLLYRQHQHFDLAARIGEAREDLGLAEGQETPPAILALAKQVRRHDGEICWTSAQLVIDSVLHTTMEVAEWLTDFEDRIALIGDEIGELTEERRRAGQETEARHIETLAKQLAADPAFNFGRTSAAKRLLLAQTMFPSETSRLLQLVVELAERIDWLEQSGFR
jgi:hypothetical protein